jgi:hypothetical protein
MIPNEPFILRVGRKTGMKRWQEDKAFLSLPAAMAAYTGWTRRPDVTSVTLLVILEQSTREDMTYAKLYTR